MSQLFPSDLRDVGPVECLGLTFANDAERRAYFTERLREKLRDPEFRKSEGFPIGSDEDILALSDPPYYTACPNPFIEEWVRCYGRPYDPDEPYSKEPFAADVSEGKNDPIYNAHSYHTKVPHKAIMRYILHYTEPGDIVLDGFCGTGMTGVAAQLCGNPDPEFKAKIEQEWKEAGREAPEWGARHAILGDLSPAATFIAYNYNAPVDVTAFEREAKRILAEVEAEYGWMYETTHTDGRKGRINYTVWSDVFVCPVCSNEIVFWETAVDKQAGEVLDEFFCPNCNASLTKRVMERAEVTRFDEGLNQSITQAKQVPVLINYSVGKDRYEKSVDQFDLDLIDKIEQQDVPYWFPVDRMPEGDEARRNDDIGMTHVHHFYTKRNLLVLSNIFAKLPRLGPIGKFLFSSASIWCQRTARLQMSNYFRGGGGVIVPTLSGTLYVGSTSIETNVVERFNLRTRISSGLPNRCRSHYTMTSICSADEIIYNENQVDYIFTDPPFGSNLMYSELNFLWEAWLKVSTNNEKEAVESKDRGKDLLKYQSIMKDVFCAYFNILKQKRWMTVEFSNTKASIWNAIQTALEQAGFVVANVSAMDKQKRSFKAVTTPTAVKQDLVISCYKPDGDLEARFRQQDGGEIGAWDFIASHLGYLPVFMNREGKAVEIVERSPRILYDRLVAYFVRHGYPVPLSAQEFQAGLHQRFPERDGMYFLAEQVAEYERKRLSVREIQQQQLFVNDEISAVQWLRQQLINKPQTRSELTPPFMQELNSWPKHEKLLELRDLLDENYLSYDGIGPIPAQIVAWMKKSSELRDLIAAQVTGGDASENAENGALTTQHGRLLAAARDRWYVPDPNKAVDLEKVRLRGLLKEFESYVAGRGKLKQFRTEAVRAGFKQAWNERQYDLIVRVAERLPEAVVQEDPDLLMYYDNASLRAGR